MPPRSNSVEALKTRLEDFLSKVKAAYGSGKDIPEREKNRLQDEYRKLYAQYGVVSSDAINSKFDARLIRAVNFLSLGLENGASQFYKETAHFFSEDANQTAIAIATFFKTKRAYDLCNSTASNKLEKKGKEDRKELERELVAMFGSLLGVQVTSEFVRSMKIEELGRIFGYALSGLCEQDMRQWNDPKAGKSLRASHKTLDEYLKHVIRRSDKMTSFRFQDDPDENGDYPSAFRVFEEIGFTGNRPRGRNSVDHCFVKKNEDGSGVLTLGSSTSLAVAEEHANSFSQAVLAAKAMVKQKKINGKPNPYFGFKVQTYVCFAGMMPTLDEKGNVIPSKVVKMLEEGRSPSHQRLTQSQVEDIARMPFFSMFGSTNPTPLIAQGMEEVNPIILGCDTYPTYSALIREGRVRATYSTSRKTAVFVLQQVAKVARLLAQDNTTIDLSKVGPQKVIQPVLHSLLRISKNYFLEFPVKENQELKSEERRLMTQIGQDFIRIAEKVEQKTRRLDVANELLEEGERISSATGLQRRIERQSSRGQSVDGQVRHDEELFASINPLKRFESSKHVQMASQNLRNLIVAGKAAQFFEVFMAETKDQNLLDAADNKFWDDYQSCLMHALDGKTNKEWKGSNFASWPALQPARTAFIEANSGPVADFVKATGNLIGQKSPTGGRSLVDRISYDAVIKASDESLKSLVLLTQALESEPLMALIKSLEKPLDLASHPRKKALG